MTSTKYVKWLKKKYFKANDSEETFSDWIQRNGNEYSEQVYRTAVAEHSIRQEAALLRKRRMMDKDYVRNHPQIVVPDNWRPREHSDPREWTDSKGRKRFGSKRHVVTTA